MIQRVVRTALASRLDHVAVVIGHRAPELQQILNKFSSRQDFSIVWNPDYEKGMSGSIKAGLRHVMHQYPSIMLMLGDMPGITADMIDRLIDQFRATDREICVPVYKGRNGHPVLFGKSVYPEILQLQGDIGAREIIAARPQKVFCAPVDNHLVLMDIDTPEDLNVFLSRQADLK